MSPQRVCLVSRGEPGTTGTSRYVDELAGHLQDEGWSVAPLSTEPRGPTRRALDVGQKAGTDLATFLASYPLRLRWPVADVYHLTGQTYASALLLGRPPGPVVATVHDIIPYLLRNSRSLGTYKHWVHRAVDFLAMRGLRRADRLIADSAWTKRTLVEQLGVDQERIEVVALGVDGNRYHWTPASHSILERYRLNAGATYLLYVGSEDPRKNLPALLRALAIVRLERPDVVLLKAGEAHHATEHRKLLDLTEELDLVPAVRWMGTVPETDMPSIYSLASVYVQPSLYEGFGLPVLEARACETRLVVSDRAALPEISPPASIVPPTPEDLAGGILSALAGDQDRTRQAEDASSVRGRFTWRAAARRTAAIYGEVASRSLDAALPARTVAR